MKPVIKVWCLPSLPEDRLKEIFNSIVKTIESIPQLGLRGEESIVVLFPTDAMKYGLGSEIVIEASGFEVNVVQPPTSNSIAFELATTIKKFFPKARVQCTVAHINRWDGFWSG